MANLAKNYFNVFKNSIARIYHANGAVVGTGFLVSERYVLTCAHVVASALSIPDNTPETPIGEIDFDLPLIAAEKKFKARVNFWKPVSPAEELEDIAGLKVESQLPNEAKPVSLMGADDLWGHPLRLFGFPKGHNDGVWGTGILRDRTGKGWIQIEDIKVTGYQVEPGFSGAPIWDEQLSGVVGMTVAAERKRENVKAAFMIPSQILTQAGLEFAVAANQPTATLNPIQQIKRQALQQRLDSLMANYEAAWNQLNYTLSAVDRNILQNQIAAIEQEMERVIDKQKSLEC